MIRERLGRLVRRAVRYRRWLVPWRMVLYERRLRRRLPDWTGVVPAGGEGGRRDGGGAPLPGAKRILVATSTGGHISAASMDSLLVAALMRRGAAVEVLLCDAALPACMLSEKHILPDEERVIAVGPRPLCRHCAPAGERLHAGTGARIRRIGEFLGEADRARARAIAADLPAADLPGFRFEGLPVGEQALAGTLRYYAVGDLDREPNGERMLRRYLEAAILTAIAGARLMAEGFDALVLHHAIYVPQGVLAAAGKAAGTRVVAWNTAYRTGCFIFSHGDTYHFTLIEETEASFAGDPFTPAMRERTIAYLDSRRHGGKDWITYQRSDRRITPDDLGLVGERPIVSLMTNIIWDAQLYYTSNAFATMKDWVLDTIARFAARPDLQLVVRIHPAEIHNPLAARQLMADEIAAAFPVLPDNVRVVPPDDPLSTYALADLSDTILIFGTKMGVELAAAGKPVIVAGEAWIRNKGIAYEANDAEAYHALLDRLPLGPTHDPAMSERALRYAHYFFFRCMIPVASTRAQAGWPPFEIAVGQPEDLDPGRDPGLDIICEGILQGTPFLWPGADADGAAPPGVAHPPARGAAA